MIFEVFDIIQTIIATPGVKIRNGQALKTWNQNGRPRLPAFNNFKSFGHDNLTIKHCYFRCSRPPGVDMIKNFNKDNQVAKIVLFTLIFVAWLFLQKLWSHQYQEALNAQNCNALQWGYHDQVFIFQSSKGIKFPLRSPLNVEKCDKLYLQYKHFIL